ncbi:MAG: LemA family protein [Phycisphaerales bacterium]|nr:LemA family protein [Phycisphaerales bacterium]
MKRTLIIILVVIVVIVFWAISVRNNLATAVAGINGKWGEVETQYERKKNLYDNIVATIKGAARNEDTTLIKIVQMRSRIPNIDQNNPQSINLANKGYDQLKSSINLTVESYPTLQTTGAFKDFQIQIEGTENRIAVAIRDWNSAITAYNQSLVTFPNNMIAGMFGYLPKPNYQSTEGAKDTKVNFD